MLEKIVTMLKAAFVDWNFWVAIATAGTALLALFQTRYQIKLSNKQHLFDRRTNRYTLANELVQSYEDGGTEDLSGIFQKDANAKALTMVAAVTLVRLTDNSYFQEVSMSLDLLAEGRCPEFVRRTNELQNIAVELPLIFDKRVAYILADFVRKYGRFVERVFEYTKYSNDEKMAGIKSDILSFAGIEVEKESIEQHEMELRETLYEAYTDLQKAYTLVKKEKVLEKLHSEMKLV